MHPVPFLQVLISSPPPPLPFSTPSPPSFSLAPSLPTSSSSFQPLAASFRPSIAVIIGVLTTMFSLTFLLLLYAKHCKRNIDIHDRTDNPSTIPTAPALPLLRGRDSGVDIAIIDSLPTFSFASLHGQKEGLECAVCLCRFDSSDVLRLLPKCKHAFHLECVDTWLCSHSSCPLCRNRVDADDVLSMDGLVAEAKCLQDDQMQTPMNSGAARVSSARRSVNVDGLHLHVQREEGEGDLQGLDMANFVRGASRKESVSRSGSRREKLAGEECMKGSLLQHAGAWGMDEQEFAKRFRHRIVISNPLSQHRWSDFVPTDALLFLSSQEICAGLSSEVAMASSTGTSAAQLGQPPRRSGSSTSDFSARLSNARIPDAFLGRLGQPGLFRAEGEPDIENGWKLPKWRFLQRSSPVVDHMASYQRSVSEVSGIRRYVDCNKSPAVTSEVTKRWFSLARKTLTWMMGDTKGRPFQSDL